MLNPTAEVLQKENANGNDDLKKLPHSKIEKNSKGKGAEKGVLNRMKSPRQSKRMLPSAPSALKPKSSHISKSSEDLLTRTDDGKSLMTKYKYSSLPRKKDKAAKTSSTSTFYVNNSPKPEKKELSNSQNNSPLMLKKKTSLNNLGNSTDKTDYNNDIVTSNNTDKQTHIALYKFHARHKDEISFNDGDPIQVLKCYEDLWYEGINLLSGKQGVFPCRYVAEILPPDLIASIENDTDHRQFHMRFLGSVEVNSHKGDEILNFAIAKVVNQRSMLSTSNPPSCVLQVSSKGLRICNLDDNLPTTQNEQNDKKPRKGKQVDVPSGTEEQDVAHFFTLKNVTYCGNHPKDRRYFGFITKHPEDHRYACHIFMSKYSTDNICKLIGECFKKYYSSYLEMRAPIEDLYIE